MRVRTFYRLSLLLPVVVPAMATLVTPKSPFIDNVVATLYLSMRYAGIPYVGFAVTLAIAVQWRTDDQIRRLAYWTPELFWMTELAWLAILMLPHGRPSASNVRGLLALIIPTTIVVAYAYVIVIDWIRAMGLRRGWLMPTLSAGPKVSTLSPQA